MSMRRWLAKNRPQADVRVIYNVRTPQDVIFADEWRNYPVTLVAKITLPKALSLVVSLANCWQVYLT